MALVTQKPKKKKEERNPCICDGMNHHHLVKFNRRVCLCCGEGERDVVAMMWAVGAAVRT